MKNKQTYLDLLQSAVILRKHIQDDLRNAYNKYKKVFQKITGKDGKIFKHLVDMSHYRNGGYPQPNSQAKHLELLDRFAWFVQYFEFIGLKREFIDVYLLKEHGITVNLMQHKQIKDFTLSKGQLNSIKKVLGTDITLGVEQSTTFKDLLMQMLYKCDSLQGEICADSNVIKRQIAENVQEDCEIKKGDFTSSVMFNYRVANHRIGSKDIQRIKEGLRSKTETAAINITRAVAAEQV